MVPCKTKDFNPELLKNILTYEALLHLNKNISVIYVETDFFIAKNTVDPSLPSVPEYQLNVQPANLT